MGPPTALVCVGQATVLTHRLPSCCLPSAKVVVFIVLGNRLVIVVLHWELLRGPFSPDACAAFRPRQRL